MQDGIHAADSSTQRAIQSAMHSTYEYLISSLDDQPGHVDQSTGLSLFQFDVVQSYANFSVCGARRHPCSL